MARAPRRPGRRGPARRIGVVVGTLAILVIGLYGPATLAGPLPEARVTVVPNPAGATSTPDAKTDAGPVLPKAGASALAAGAPHPSVIAHAGTDDAVPLAGVAKLVTALVVLHAKPLAAGRQGPLVTMTKTDADDYAQHVSQGDLGILVQQGEQWSELQMLQAMLLGSSNNHADSLARWAFGSIQGYTDAAGTWLRAHGLTHTTVVDASGLSEHDTGTASDAARLAALAMQNAAIAHLFEHPVDSLLDGRPLENLTVYKPKLGVRGLSRSYTDQAGVCFVFALTTTVGGHAVTSYGAFLRQPDYPSLSSALTRLAASAKKSVHRHVLVKEGTAYARVEAPWGEQVEAVAEGTVAVTGWRAPKVHRRVEVGRVDSARPGARAGTVRVTGDGIDHTVELAFAGGLHDPGLPWRLEHPIVMTRAFIAALIG